MNAMKKQMVSLGLVVLVMFLVSGALAGDQNGSFWYTLDHLTSAKEGAQAVVWVTLPPVWHGQEIEVSSIIPEPVAVLEDKKTGNRVIEWVYRPSDEKLPMNYFFHFDFKLKK